MKAFSRLLIPEVLVAEMIQHALDENPLECCGLLAGTMAEEVATVAKRYPLINALESETEFYSDAKSLLLAHKDMRAQEIDLLAVYHSHPTSEPIPSRKDLERSVDPDVACLIVSLVGEPHFGGWWLLEEEYRELDWERI